MQSNFLADPTMYEIPGRAEVKKCVVNADAITKRHRPLLLNRMGQPIEFGEGLQRETA